jgi:DNA polymerase-3 subunit gamma/tau
MVLLRLLAFKPAAAEKKSLKLPEVTPAEAPKAKPVAALAGLDAPPAALHAPKPELQASGLAAESILHPDLVKKVAIVQTDRASVASNFVAIPVRAQPEAGPRSQPRPDAIDGARTDFEPTPEGDFWHGLVTLLVQAESVTALARELALQSQLVGRDSDVWTLRVERESLTQPATRDKLQAALSAAGHPVTLAVEIGAVRDSPARRNAAAQAERQRAAEGIILSDPFVQQMMQDYGARIVAGSLRPA